MREVTVLAIGKLRDVGLRSLCDDYYQRCRRRFRVIERELKDLSALPGAIPSRRRLVLLDERGDQLTSRVFAKTLAGWLGGPHPLIFGIGGADGFGELRGQADALLSLGPMTYAHRLVRVLFAEQLYRAVSILDGSPYHRD